MIYEVFYPNNIKTVTQDFDSVVAAIRDLQVDAIINVWEKGNCILSFEIKDRAKHSPR